MLEIRAASWLGIGKSRRSGQCGRHRFEIEISAKIRGAIHRGIKSIARACVSLINETSQSAAFFSIMCVIDVVCRQRLAKCSLPLKQYRAKCLGEEIKRISLARNFYVAAYMA